jgi:hypothetical protein
MKTVLLLGCVVTAAACNPIVGSRADDVVLDTETTVYRHCDA